MTPIVKPNYGEKISYNIYFDWNLNKNIHHIILDILMLLKYSKNKIWMKFDFLTNLEERMRKIYSEKSRINAQNSLKMAGGLSG